MHNNTVPISKCCQAEVTEDFKDNPRDHRDPIEIYRCTQCKKECELEDDEVCADCLGTGEVTVDEAAYAGEPHMAPIGTRTCRCKAREHDDYDGE